MCIRDSIYDGQEIEEFKTRDKEDYLSGNLIDNIVYTGEDVYWIQTYYGLNRLNRKTNTITHYNEFQKLFFMNKDSHGNLFIIQDSNCICLLYTSSCWMTKSLFVIACILLAPKSAMDKQKALVIFMVIVFFCWLVLIMKVLRRRSVKSLQRIQ